MSALADAAAGLAAMGMPVFPVAPRGKVPLIAKADGGRGCHDATIDADTVHGWWTRWPAANIGLAAGTACVVLDVDGDDGLAALADLEDMHRWLPVTVTSITGSGGQHLFFTPNARVRNTVKKLGPGLDTRGVGGSAVAPPSIHPNGNRYRWLEGRDPWSVPLAEVPDWMLELLDPPRPAWSPPAPRQQPTARYVAVAMHRELEAVSAAPKGRRNLILNNAAFSLGRFVADGELNATDVGEALIIAAMSAGLSRDDARRTTHSGLLAAVRRAA